MGASHHPPIKVNKRLTIHSANGKVRKQKRAVRPPLFSTLALRRPFIIKQTFSRLDPRSSALPARRKSSRRAFFLSFPSKQHFILSFSPSLPLIFSRFVGIDLGGGGKKKISILSNPPPLPRSMYPVESNYRFYARSKKGGKATILVPERSVSVVS